MKRKPEPLLWLSDARGRYIPRDFANSFVDRFKAVSGVSDADWTILEAGPEHEHYWKTWDDILNHVVVTNDDGEDYTMYQDGDLWLIPEGMEWSDKQNFYVWPENEEEHARE